MDPRVTVGGCCASAFRHKPVSKTFNAKEKKPDPCGPGSVCRRGTADTHLPEGNNCRNRIGLIWGDATTQLRQHDKIMRPSLLSHNAKHRMSAMRCTKNSARHDSHAALANSKNELEKLQLRA